jgi:hypothetical protein
LEVKKFGRNLPGCLFAQQHGGFHEQSAIKMKAGCPVPIIWAELSIAAL